MKSNFRCDIFCVYFNEIDGSADLATVWFLSEPGIERIRIRFVFDFDNDGSLEDLRILCAIE